MHIIGQCNLIPSYHNPSVLAEHSMQAIIALFFRLFRGVNAALIVFNVRDRKSFLRAVSTKSWFEEVNHRCGDIPPVKILGIYYYIYSTMHACNTS